MQKYIWFIIIFLACIVSRIAFASLEIGVSQMSSDRCNAKIKGYIAADVSEDVISLTFNPSAQPIIFNNCSFIVVDKKKRKVLIFGGKTVSAVGCDKKNICNVSFKPSKNPNAVITDTEEDIMDLVSTDNSVAQVAVEQKKVTKKASKGKKITVVIDAGHGGQDPGAIGRYKTKEKDVTLKYAKFIARRLQKDGFKVILTRDSDTFLKLHERIDFAMQEAADIFISIHADSAQNVKARGATIYTLSPHAINAATSRAEERTNISGNFLNQEDDEDLIFNILNIQHRSNVAQASDFAKMLTHNMKLSKIRLTSIPVRSADFAVLKAPIFPAILLELGYISNTEDEKLMQSKEYMEKMSTVISKTLKENYL